MYSEAKAAQMAAYLLHRCGGRTEYIKILKLMYLADRASLDQRGMSISEDSMVSMPYGPVLSKTYNHMMAPSSGEWDKLIDDDSRYQISLKRPISLEDDQALLELSIADIRLMDYVVDQFGKMSWKQLVDYTHDQCEEWKDPQGSSHPIRPYEVFRALGRDPDAAEELERLVKARSQYRQEMDAYL